LEIFAREYVLSKIWVDLAARNLFLQVTQEAALQWVSFLPWHSAPTRVGVAHGCSSATTIGIFERKVDARTESFAAKLAVAWDVHHCDCANGLASCESFAQLCQRSGCQLHELLVVDMNKG
jgi:hypothetical protein